MARRSVLKLVCQLFRADVLVIEQAARIGALDAGVVRLRTALENRTGAAA
jgi:hypothetical protein